MFNISLDSIGKSPKKLKSLLSIVFLIPVWYSVLFIFHRDFFNDNHFSILLCLSYSLTLAFTGFISSAFIMFIRGMDNLSNRKFRKLNFLSFKVVFYTCILHLMVLLLSMVIGMKSNTANSFWCIECNFKNIEFVTEKFWSALFISVLILSLICTGFRIITSFIKK